MDDYLLSIATSVQGRMRSAMSGWEELTPTEARLLLELLRSTTSTNAKLTKAIDSDTALETWAVKELCEKGLVARTLNEALPARPLLHLTGDGHKQASAIQEKQSGLLLDLVRALSPAERAVLARLADRLKARVAAPRLAHHIEVEVATPEDLSWLIVQVPSGRYASAAAKFRLFAHRTEELKLAVEAPGRWAWIVRNWGERVGGCALALDRAAEENAWINLIYIQSGLEREAGTPLLRACIAEATDITFVEVKAMPLLPSPALAELFSHLGFQPIASEVRWDLDERCDTTIWSRRLLPPLMR